MQQLPVIANERDLRRLRPATYSDQELVDSEAVAEGDVRRHRENIIELRREIARAKDPDVRRVLQEEYNRLQGAADSADETPETSKPAAAAPSGLTPLVGKAENTGNAPSGLQPMVNLKPSPAANAAAVEEEIKAGPNPAFSQNDAGAVTGIQRERKAGLAGPDDTVGPPEKRLGLEVGGAATGAAAGSILGPLGTIFGAGAGAVAGSLLAEGVDPTQQPIKEALTTGAFSMGGQAVLSGNAHLFRYMLGKPSANGQHLLEIMEARGLVPPAGTVLEGSLAKNMQAIGSSDAFFGRRVQQAVMESGNVVTDDLRNFVSAYQRYYGGAKEGFKIWDTATKQLLGAESDIVALDRGVIDKLKVAQRTWDSVGASVDFPLRQMLDDLAKAEATYGKINAFRVSLEQAEAVRQLLHQQANALAGTARNETGQAVGKDVVRAVRDAAYKVGDDIEYAIDLAVKDGRIPAQTRAILNESREMWKQWKVGEAIQNEFIDVLKLNERNGAPITSQVIYGALKNIEQEGRRLHKAILSPAETARLESMGKAMQAVEESGHSTQFTMAVRAGQLFSISGGAGLTGTAMSMTLVPAALGFIVRNPEAAALMIRGMRLPAGSAAALRTANQLQTLLQKEGYLMPVERNSGAVDQSESGQ